MNISRRDFLAAAAAGPALASAAPLLAHEPAAVPLGKAEHCIFIWLGGGASQIDTWDPKAKGDAKARKAGSYYDAIPTAIPGVEVCEHLSRCAPLLDRFAVLRTVHHEVIDEHARATNQVHTGRPTTGTIIYPSIGSAVSHTRGPINDRVPTYMLLGFPNVTRGPGFLGARAGFVYLTDTRSGPAGFARQPEITDARQQRREALLDEMRKGYRSSTDLPELVADYDTASREALRMQRFARQLQCDHRCRHREGKCAPEAASEPRRLVEQARQQAAHQPATGISHVVEAHIERDLVPIGVVENQVRVDGRVQRKDRAKNGKAAHNGQGRRQPCRQRERNRRRHGREGKGHRRRHATSRRPAAQQQGRGGLDDAIANHPERHEGADFRESPPEHPAQKDRHTDHEPDVARPEEEKTRGTEYVDLAAL